MPTKSRSTHGQRGGTGKTAGLTAETIEATFADGSILRKRVFFGQRAMTLIASEKHGELVQAWRDTEEAQRYLDRTDRDEWPAQLLAPASVVNKAADRTAREARGSSSNK